MKYTNLYEKVVNSTFFMNIFIGGRGIGKTYSILNETRKHRDHVIYMRTTDETIKMVCSAGGSPYKQININESCDVQISNNSTRTIIERMHENPDDKEEITGEYHLGFCFSLSTFYKMRGTSFPEVNFIYYDEFLEQEKSATRRISPSAFFQAVETVQRNRELEGYEPVKLVLTANSFTLDNNILRYLNLVDVIQKMYVSDEKIWCDPERSIYIELLENKDISLAKQNTALYRLTKGTSFYDMALENDFTDDSFGDIKKIPFNELYPVCRYSDITFYKHKNRELIFASSRKAQCTEYSIINHKLFLKDYGYLLRKYQDFGMMLYQSYNVKLKVYDILK